MIHDFSGVPLVNPHASQAQPDFRSDAERDQPLQRLDDPGGNDLAAAARQSRELMSVYPSVPVYARTNNYDYDDVFDEDADPTYLPPVMMHAFFRPQPMEFELKRWGAEAVNKTEVVFGVAEVQEHFGERMLRAGDVIELPYNNPQGKQGGVGTLNPGFYRVLNGSPAGNFRFHWLYFTCAVETLSGDITVRPKEDLPPITEGSEPGGAVRGIP